MPRPTLDMRGVAATGGYPPIAMPSPAQLERLHAYSIIRSPASGLSDALVTYTRLSGRLDPERLRWSLTEVAKRHDALRMRFSVSGDPRDLVGRPEDLDRVTVGLAEPGAGAVGFTVRRLARDGASDSQIEVELGDFSSLALDLERGPRVRALLLELDDHEWVLALAVDHIVADRASMSVILGELAACYAGGDPLPPAPSYLQYARSQWSSLQSRDGQARLAYWVQQFDRHGVVPPARLRGQPDDGERPGWSRLLRRELAPDVVRRLAQRAGSHATTPFNVYLAAFCTSLWRHVDGEAIGVVTPVTDRWLPETDGMIGLLTTMVPVWVPSLPQAGFAEAIGQVSAATIASIEHCLPMHLACGAYLDPASGGRRYDARRMAELWSRPTVEFYLEREAPPVLDLPGIASSPYELRRPVYQTLGGFGLMVRLADGAGTASLWFAEDGYPEDQMTAILDGTLSALNELAGAAG